MISRGFLEFVIFGEPIHWSLLHLLVGLPQCSILPGLLLCTVSLYDYS